MCKAVVSDNGAHEKVRRAVQQCDQNSADFGVRGNGIASLIFPMPVTNNTKRSSPMP